MKKVLATEKFLKVGNNLSLDFINTKIAQNGQPKDLIENFTDLAAWTVAMDLLEKASAEKLIIQWNDSSEVAEAFLQAIEFRGVLHEMYGNLTNGKKVGKQAIAAINRHIQNQNGAIEIKQTENGFEKLFRTDFRVPSQLLAPVAESAADLLCYGNPAHIRKCENPDCVLYFYDETKNHTRRWCSMSMCGNRAKAAAFYQREKLKNKTSVQS